MNNAAAPLVPGLRITEIELCAWIGQAAPRDAFEYHRGFLVVDVDTRNTALTCHERAELARVAQRAWQAADNDLVHLVQQRRGPNEFSYFAVARPRPKPASRSLSSLLFEKAASSPLLEEAA